MATERNELETLSREQLLERARRAGLPSSRIETLPRADLIDEIVFASISDTDQRRAARGFLGRARDLVSRVVSKGLNLPDAAQRIFPPSVFPAAKAPQPLPTVALAQVYARQGHLQQAVEVLDAVLAEDPHHGQAGELRRLWTQGHRVGASASTAKGVASPRGKATEVDTEGGGNSPAGRVPSHPADSQRPAFDVDRAVAAAKPARDSAQGASATSACDAAEKAVALEAVEAAAPAPPGEAPPVEDHLAVVPEATKLHITWSLRPLTFARVRRRGPSGHLSIRVVHYFASTAHGDRGLRCEVEDTPVAPLRGNVEAQRPSGSVDCAVACGWRVGVLFFPVITVPRDVFGR